MPLIFLFFLEPTSKEGKIKINRGLHCFLIFYVNECLEPGENQRMPLTVFDLSVPAENFKK